LNRCWKFGIAEHSLLSSSAAADLLIRRLENREIVTQGVGAPKAAAKLIALPNRYSAKERKDQKLSHKPGSR
jgi:hypothetical protein